MGATAAGNPRVLLALASAAVALAAADTYVVVLALTDMMAGVGIGIDALQRATPIISGFLLGYIAVLPLIGRLADLVPRGRILLACLLVFIVGSGITALATDLGVLVGGRVIQGIGGGGLVPATLALVADLWPRERRGTPLGMVGAVQELGSVLGPLLGAAILTVSDWRAIFVANVVLGLLLAGALVILGRRRGRGPAGRPGPVRPAARTALASGLALAGLGLGWLALAAPAALASDVTLGLPFVPFGEASSRALTPIGLAAALSLVAAAALTAPAWVPVLRRADVPGALLLGGVLSCVVLTFAASDPEREVVGPLGFTLLPVGVALALLYVWRHRTAAEPLVPRGTVRGRTGWSLVVSLLVGVALVAVIVDVPLMARLTLTESQVEAALVLLKFLIAVPVGAFLGGWALRLAGDGLVAGIGLCLTTVGLLVMAQWERGSLATITSAVVLAVVGLGVGLALAPVNAAALADAPADAHGTASALVVVSRMIGMVVGLALLTAIGLHSYYGAVAELPDQTDGQALLGAALVQVRTVFVGAATAAALGALASFMGLGLRRGR
ncbi:MFS transporter [Janibacter sp. G1551]|uniref:MFS transporter n=1 Tax=Janibacter sp. G1551 TaxID=3420440 RepID=UPI003D021280